MWVWVRGVESDWLSTPLTHAGLGDVAVPGLLACLALRYDASRSVDMRTRGIAVAQAMQEALDALEVGGWMGGWGWIHVRVCFG